MSLGLAARFAARELRGGLKGFWIFLACLALGVAAIAAVGSVRSSIETGLAREGAALLGGDAEMEFTYRFASDAERAWMQDTAQRVSEVTDFRSMATVTRDGDTERGLTQVKSVDGAYPLIGNVELAPEMSLSQALAGQDGLPGGVMAPILADRLALKVGDTFRLGSQDFVLMARLAREPDNAGGGFGLGPRTLVATDALADAGLLQPGTLFETQYRLDLPEGADLAALEAQAKARFADTGLRWRDARNGAPGVADFVERIGAFLILVGLSGLAVGGVGVSAAVRAYLAGKTGVIATLRTLGAERAMIFQTYFLQIGALSLLGIGAGLVLGALAPLALAPVLQAQLPVPAVFALYPGPLAEAAIYGLLTALVFTLWPLARTEDIRAATLFRDGGQSGQTFPRAIWVALTVALVAALVAVAGVFSGTWALTLWTAGGLLVALFMLALAAWGIRVLARVARVALRPRPALRWALGAISGRGAEATSVVLSLGLGLSVLAAVGQIDGNLRDAIARDLPDRAPSYFFLDIQREQMPGFLARVEDDPAVSKTESAPMLRGIITQINDRPAAEVAGEHWVIQGDRGVTYAAAQPEGTEVTAGEWWTEDYDGPPQISFAAEEAEEMGLQLGDTLTVNILGRDITGTITSFRNVDFSTAGMGFIMAMNEAALADAPHSFIATVYAEPEAEAAILRDVSNAYPNITAIRVRDAIDRVSEVLSGLAAATSWGAAATLVTGFLVLIGAAAAGDTARVYEAAVLRTLGATRGRILASFALRAGLLGLGAGLVALAAGIAGGWAVSHFVFETDFGVIWSSAIGIVLGGVLATLLSGLAFAWRPLAVRPAGVLRARE
ncbi:FtsX-like permease family protein [Lutimaribacter sp. EGI FJ00015]|uniref:FtsX-like permease family protein n=1 Tax=Lutimaribacter degradans TaxID=2945989 RepID=A0ACC5ZUC6_9RHOB|nr:FtsX-like permease family protein [Lutimaribacter sp. EGI FJ00013]MCM2561735.1 FtsX-like permease family protein [Lutimaribacter sp. EGI FJ00013]MCO0612552.1 FtsX-like permease family protein [Lutimaribacter sp. EGI FJ00015]MCO0635211.1 FtsX-like permease family protein [Lutimaribacter sp. EGI FJ00014]